MSRRYAGPEIGETMQLARGDVSVAATCVARRCVVAGVEMIRQPPIAPLHIPAAGATETSTHSLLP